jgi:hypothetical protein
MGHTIGQFLVVPSREEDLGFIIPQGQIRKCKSDIIAKLDALQPHHNTQDHQNLDDANVSDSPSSKS